MPYSFFRSLSLSHVHRLQWEGHRSATGDSFVGPMCKFVRDGSVESHRLFSFLLRPPLLLLPLRFVYHQPLSSTLTLVLLGFPRTKKNLLPRTFVSTVGPRLVPFLVSSLSVLLFSEISDLFLPGQLSRTCSCLAESCIVLTEERRC